jgi:hypothetical protein
LPERYTPRSLLGSARLTGAKNLQEGASREQIHPFTNLHDDIGVAGIGRSGLFM